MSTLYSTSRHVYDICRAKLSGLVGYRCNACDFDIHEAFAPITSRKPSPSLPTRGTLSRSAACLRRGTQRIPLRHFAHPEHLLLKTRYVSTSGHVCDICGTKLSGLVGYRCNACDFDIHEACADYFKETISFFAS
uniref:Phorbol-ester/DAG-type domain-containing protein n=1 Tax=Leersia perrieri TaxID=77586 RepID=A0A0D9X1E4_9ORYZ